jgi:clan AA aspartic protease
VTVALRGPFGSTTVDAVIDTGFTGALSVPSALAVRLGLLRWSVTVGYGTDGQIRSTRVYLAEIEWTVGWMQAEAAENGIDLVLIGAELLRGHELLVNYGAAQSVEIR